MRSIKQSSCPVRLARVLVHFRSFPVNADCVSSRGRLRREMRIFKWRRGEYYRNPDFLLSWDTVSLQCLRC